MARKHILLIDGENILHQSFHKFEKLRSTDGRPSGAIFGFFRSLHMYIKRYNPDKVFITFDNGRSPYRLNLIPNYKGHRKNISIDYESLQKQKEVIMQILVYLRIPYIFDRGKSTVYEGDDFLAYLFYKKFKDPKKYKVTIISSDKDFNQLLIHDKVNILNPRKDETVRISNCKELFGYEAEDTVYYLSMVGDKSDDIEGIKGIGPKKASSILEKHRGNIMEYFTGDNKDIIARNFKMINLLWFINMNKLSIDDLPIRKTSKARDINIDKFKEICVKYSLSSFLTNLFLQPFEDLNNKKSNK